MRTRSSPLPFLPLEVKHDILRFCDPSTLAKTARVCLAFLQLSGPLLYRDISVRGVKKLKKLVRSETLQTIRPFLSLAQTSSLTYIFIHDGANADASLCLPDLEPISLDELVVDLQEIHTPRNPDLPSIVFLNLLLTSVSPSRLRVLASTPTECEATTYLDLERAIVGWTNLELMLFTNSAPCPNEICLYQRSRSDVVYDFSSVNWGEAFERLVETLLDDYGHPRRLVWVAKVLVWVNLECQKDWVNGLLLAHCEGLSFEVKVKATTT